ncbi:unnamed protein product [Rhizophagus irregularis]|nr:unnamed protein product [Rhizophagus irregularis]
MLLTILHKILRNLRCLDSDPLKRPKAKEIEDILYNWYRGLLTYESRLLDFNNLPEPKNSDDYYEQNDNIISKEFLESLEYCRIDIP